VSSPQTLKPQHIIAATPCKQNLSFAERRRLNELARLQRLSEARQRLRVSIGPERYDAIIKAQEEEEKAAAKAADRTIAAPAPVPVAAPVTAPEPTPADTTDRPATSAELEELLADLDMNALAGTETIEEVIEDMTADGLADLDESDEPITAPAPAAPAAPVMASDNLVKEDDQPKSTKMSTSGVCDDILVNSKRPESVFRDAQFMRNLKGFLHSDPVDRGDTTLSVLHSPPSTSLPVASLIEFFDHVSRYTPWWDKNGGEPLPAPARQYRKPAPWRDATDYLRISYRHLAIQSLGPVFTLTLNLSPAIEAKARSKASPLGWLHKRVAHYLKKELKRDVEFHLILEETDHHRLHIHGELQINAEEAKEARAALRRAGGKWEDEAIQKQARSEPVRNRGWLDYIVADLWRVQFTRSFLPRYRLNKLPSGAITFNGSATSSTSGLNAKAAALYNQHRSIVIDCAEDSQPAPADESKRSGCYLTPASAKDSPAGF
jgi:hypothetical protein